MKKITFSILIFTFLVNPALAEHHSCHKYRANHYYHPRYYNPSASSLGGYHVYSMHGWYSPPVINARMGDGRNIVAASFGQPDKKYLNEFGQEVWVYSGYKLYFKDGILKDVKTLK